MKVCTSTQMQFIDKCTIEEYGISGVILMERAGLACCEVIDKSFANAKAIAVLCGSGNNGGDGFAVARMLHNKGRDVICYHLVDLAKVSGDASVHLQMAIKSGVKLKPISEFKADASKADLIVDAIFGTGLNRDVSGDFAKCIDLVNTLGKPVLAVDIPSGVCANTGRVLGSAVKATKTVTFGLAKLGHFLHPGRALTGTLHIADIGFPNHLLQSSDIKTSILVSDYAKALMPARFDDSYKNTYGHVVIVGGSPNMSGSVLLASKACLRVGAGLVTVASSKEVLQTLSAKVLEELFWALPSDAASGMIAELPFDKFQKYDVIAIGMGMGVSKDTKAFMQKLISSSAVALVIDADGLNSLVGYTSKLKDAKCPIVLTPHHAEFSRLTGKTVSEIKSDRVTFATQFALSHNVVLVLKGSPTIVASPEGECVINTTGNAGMATAGSGDVLTGMIAGLIAQGLTPYNASKLAVYLHGLSGDIACEHLSMHSLIASDLINFISHAIKATTAP